MHRKHVGISEWNPTSPEEADTILREKSDFVLRLEWAMQFLNYYINLCLCTKQPVVLFLRRGI